jgi:hypothetical protein
MTEAYNTVLRLSRQDDFPALKNRLCDALVLKAMNDYIACYALELTAIETHDQFERQYDRTNDMTILRKRWAEDSRLRIECTETRRIRKRAWRALIDLLEEDWEYTSTDEEDEEG